MRVLVVSVYEIEKYPPIINLCRALLDIGAEVTLLSYCVRGLPDVIAGVEFVNFGKIPYGVKKVPVDIRTKVFLSDYIKKHGRKYDFVWTTSDIAARDCGRGLFECRHIMQLMELAEYTPLVTRHDIPLKSKLTPALARHAYRVVVPEINRAFIQQAWWQLERRPSVLPNKPLAIDEEPTTEGLGEVVRIFDGEKRKILLYQGVFGRERDLSGLIGAARKIGDDYALFLMGSKNERITREIARLSGGSDAVVDVPFVPAPGHLVFTKRGYIGLMPYKPVFSRMSPLNTLYCAPNKIWEYSRFGLPMVGSEVPGLISAFDRYGIGVACNIEDSDAVIDAIRRVEADYKGFSARSRAYFDSTDFTESVRRILGDA